MSVSRRSSESPAGFQVIFERPDQPVPSTPVGEASFRPRRYHTKSRNGCFNCKRRRIKCNEAQPECTHCREKSLQCQYPPTRASPQPQSPSFPSPTALASLSRQPSESFGRTDPRITAILDEDDVPSGIVVEQGYQRPDVFDLLQHIVVPTEHPWIGSSYAQAISLDHVRRHAAHTPYLLYSALAFSAAHMHHLYPADNKYRVAAPYHYQQSLRKYYDKLSGTLEEEDVDSLFVSCQLHAFLAFLNAPSAHSGRPGIELGWVRSMRGMKFITESPQLLARLRRGPFSPVMGLHAHDWRDICALEEFDSSPRSAADAHHSQLIAQLCTDHSPHDQAALSQAVGMLHDLIRLRPVPHIIATFTLWINRQPSAFIDLLQAAEPLALLTIGFWCALFSRIDQFWIVEPAKSECRRICDYVGGLGDSRYSAVLTYLRSIT